MITPSEDAPRSGSEQGALRKRGRSAPTRGERSEAARSVQTLLFLLEYSAASTPKWRQYKRYLSLFFGRVGGLHLLLMLLNAHYHKPAAGRRPGRVFSGLCDQIEISERGLRMLINDAIDAGLVEQLPVTPELDRRRRSYQLTAPVVRAWETLIDAQTRSMEDVLTHFDAGALANVDYRKWDPDKPASDQILTLPRPRLVRRRT